MQSLKYWTPEHFDFYSSFSLDKKNCILTTNGTDRSGKCTYSYNELGFRGDSIYKDGFKIMSIGCSLTEGVGVNDNENWPSIFSSFILNSVNLNFGYGGSSNDYISRCLLSYYDLIKPDLVLIMYTESHRREFYTENGSIEPFHINKWGYFNDNNDIFESLVTLSNEENSFQNWYKNHLLIKYFLESKKCNWLWNGWFTTNDYSDELRFDGDFSPFIDYGADDAHPGKLTHYKYAKNLFNYIQTNFPNYIPNN